MSGLRVESVATNQGTGGRPSISTGGTDSLGGSYTGGADNITGGGGYKGRAELLISQLEIRFQVPGGCPQEPTSPISTF